MKKLITAFFGSILLCAGALSLHAQTTPAGGTGDTGTTPSGGTGSLETAPAGGTGPAGTIPAGGTGPERFVPAGGTNAPSQSVYLQNPLKGVNSLGDLIFEILKVIVGLLYAVCAFAFLWAGFTYVTAQGNPEKLSEAHKRFWYTIIGAAIILGAQTIANVIQNIVKDLQ